MSREQFENIDDYINSFDDETKVLLIKIRECIKQAAPMSSEKISWAMPTFYYKENIIHFAAYKKHIGIYPGAQAMIDFKDKLVDYKTSTGAIQLPLDKPIPFELIKELVEYRLKKINNKE